MGALTTALEARLSPIKVQQLSTPDAGRDAAKDTDRLDAAEADASNLFADLTQTDLDTANTAHIALAVLMMEYVLITYGTSGEGEGEKLFARIEERAKLFKVRDSRGRSSVEMADPLVSGGWASKRAFSDGQVTRLEDGLTDDLI